MCGENAGIADASPIIQGSPPRVRGKRTIANTGAAGIRITPARAGKTYKFIHHFNTFRDHPRACGENIDLPTFWVTRVGSPPRVRGKLS